MILSQLVDADELNQLSPDELRDMISRLDDEVVHGAGQDLIIDEPATEETSGAGAKSSGE